MLWILLLHIIALLIWAAAVLYVPMLIVSAARERVNFTELPEGIGSMARLVFTHVASSAAVIAIIAGTLVFVVNETLTFWLLVKLTLVTLMVALHASLGLLITRLERAQLRYVVAASWILFGLLSTCIILVMWVVLAKPAVPEAIPWTL
ncbi:CopD family protein [Aliidiomarina sp. Khilg15.8]